MRRSLFALAWLAACADEAGLAESRSGFKLVGPTSYDFGSVYLGVERSTSIRMRNDGLAPMTLCAAFDPAGPGFDADQGCQDVPAGASVEIAVRFLPRVPGRAAAALELTHDAPQPSAAVPLSGEGLAIPPCDDGNVCTDDSFDPALGRCVHPARSDGSSCDDGKSCTVLDVCAAGRCVGGGRDCDDGDLCTRDLCEEPHGCVHFPGALNCNDGNPCTADGCDPEGGCFHTNLADGTPCQDGVSCTYGELCISGECTGVNVPDGTPCADADPCTTDDACRAGRCFSEEGSHLTPGDLRWTFDSSHQSDPVSPRGLRSPGTLDSAGNLYVDDDPGTVVSLDSCGRLRWQRPVMSRNLHLNYRRMATHQLLISVESESTDRPGFDVLRARLLDTGAPLWTTSLEQERCVSAGIDLPACSREAPYAVRANDAALTAWGAVVVGGNQQFDSADPARPYELTHFVTMIDATGRTRWRAPAAAPWNEWMFGYPLLVAADGRVFAGTWAGYDPTRASQLFAFSAAGVPLWTVDWPDLNDYLTGAPGMLFEASRARARDFAGRLVWERPELSSERYRLNYGAVAREGGALTFLRTSWESTDPVSELVTVSKDGALLWRHPLPGQPTASLAVADDGALYTAINSTVIAVEPNGARRWTVELPTEGQPLRNILTLGAPGHLYVATNRRLFAVWTGMGKLGGGWSRFRGGNSNGCTIESGGGP